MISTNTKAPKRNLTANHRHLAHSLILSRQTSLCDEPRHLGSSHRVSKNRLARPSLVLAQGRFVRTHHIAGRSTITSGRKSSLTEVYCSDGRRSVEAISVLGVGFLEEARSMRTSRPSLSTWGLDRSHE